MMNQEDWIRIIRPEDVDPDDEDIVEVIGLVPYLRMCQKCGGMNVRMQSITVWDRITMHRKIYELSKTCTLEQLMDAYHLPRRESVMQIIRRERYAEEHPDPNPAVGPSDQDVTFPYNGSYITFADLNSQQRVIALTIGMKNYWRLSQLLGELMYTIKSLQGIIGRARNRYIYEETLAGRSPKEIADTVGISVAHVQNVFQREYRKRHITRK